jgi:hypothetical protein
MTVTRMLAWCSLGVVLALASGCGVATGTASGKISFKGMPAAEADIKFVADADAKLEFFGRSSADGSYTMSYREMSGMPVGKYSVTIVHHVLPKGKAMPDGEAGAQLRNDPTKTFRIAKRFPQEIVSGTNTADFDLDKGEVVKLTE